VTWAFLFLACLIVGLMLGAVTGLLSRRRYRPSRHAVTLPRPEHTSPFLTTVGQRASVALVAVGGAGLLAHAWFHLPLRTALTISVLAGAVAALLALGLLRERRLPPPSGIATVVRAIQADGYGQVELLRGDRKVLMAARGVGGEAIPAGAEVEMIDCQSSVLTVRRCPQARPDA
jgi:hypothetical protein